MKRPVWTSLGLWHQKVYALKKKTSWLETLGGSSSLWWPNHSVIWIAKWMVRIPSAGSNLGSAGTVSQQPDLRASASLLSTPHTDQQVPQYRGSSKIIYFREINLCLFLTSYNYYFKWDYPNSFIIYLLWYIISLGLIYLINNFARLPFLRVRECS